VPTVRAQTPVALVQMPDGKPVAIESRIYASGADPARALRVSRRAMEPQLERRPQLTELEPRPDRNDLATSGGQRVRLPTKILPTLAGLAHALKSILDHLVAKTTGLTSVAANGARAGLKRTNCRRVEEALGFEVGHLPQQLRSKLRELSELWMTAKKRQDAAILSSDPRAFGEAHHESVEISRRS
jgi:hypothetical protein